MEMFVSHGPGAYTAEAMLAMLAIMLESVLPTGKTPMKSYCSMASACLLLAAAACSQKATVDWPHYASDAYSSKYSTLDQITAENFADLEVAWRWNSVDADLEDTNGQWTGPFKATPIMIGGLLYTSTGLSQVAAIDAETGETVWVFDPESYKRGRAANVGNQHRGVSYWADGDDRRIIIATGNRQLVALNAITGEPCQDFGQDGIVETAEGLGRDFSLRTLAHSAPVSIVRDTIILGGVVSDGVTIKEGTPGHVRGFDVRTGKQKWIFHTVPQEGEFGVETWLNESWKYSGACNVWTMMSVDPELGYVYIPTGSPTSDWYGGHRPGSNLFGESIVCLNAETGERVWHFQTVHHGLWDYDLPCAPNLVDITVDGKRIKALAQISKTAFCYVLNRETGEPIWPIEERPVPKSDVPGEWTNPTQPFPSKPPAFDRQGISEEDLIDFTPELREAALEIFRQFRSGPIFTPPSLNIEGGTRGTFALPGFQGGAAWSGAAVDPETGVMYVPSSTFLASVMLARSDPTRSNLRYGLKSLAVPKIGEDEFGEMEPDRMFGHVDGLQIVKPPYGRITAIDLNKGDHLWQVPFGEGPRQHPLLKDLNLPPLGTPNIGEALSNGGPMVTKTLLIASQDVHTSQFEGTPEGIFGWLYAYDKKTGDQVGRFGFDNAPHGVPMTYMVNGKQYIVVATGSNRIVGETDRQPAQLIALALP
jgi:quinoprotein glucose dehydrogenase